VLLPLGHTAVQW